MFEDIFSKLNIKDKATLILITLFEVSDDDARMVRALVKDITDASKYDFSSSLQVLNRYGLAVPGTYNWRNYCYNYSLNPYYLIPSMIYLAEHEQKLTSRIVKGADFLKPTNLQKVLWKFVISDFTEVMSPKTIGTTLKDNEIAIFSYLDDERFEPLVMCLDEETFCSCVNHKIDLFFENESLYDTTYLRRLLDRFPVSGSAATFRRYVGLLDLYDYMAHGIRPDRLLADDRGHQWIAALHEMYQGNYNKALGHVKMSLTLMNTKGRVRPTRRSYFDYVILNFFYVLIARLTDTDESKQRASAMIKAGNKSETSMGRTLFSIIYNQITDKQIPPLLRMLEHSSARVEKSLVSLMEGYVGCKAEKIFSPSWLILQHEIRSYVSIAEEETEKANAAYGPQGALSRLYRKKEWEHVLDELMAQSQGSGDKPRKEDRIAYIMRNTRASYATPKLQTVLKSGAWSAGRNISHFDFEQGTVKAMTDADRRIAAASHRHYDYGDITLECVLPEMTSESRLYVGTTAPYTLVEVTEEAPYITLVREDSHFRVVSNVPVDQTDEEIIITHRGAASINFLQLHESQRIYYQRMLQLGTFPLEAESQLKAFLATVGGKLEVNSDLIAGGSTLPIAAGSPQLIMQMRPQGKDLYVVALFTRPLEGGHKRCVPGEGDSIVIDQDEEGKRTRVERDVEKEKENLSHFVNACHIKGLEKGIVEIDTMSLLPLITYAQENGERMACEWPEGASLRIKKRQQSAWNGMISKNENGWFEIEGSVEVDADRMMSMAQLLDLVGKAHGRYIKLGEGEFLELSESLQKQLLSLNAIASRSHGHLQVSPFSAALLGADVVDGELQIDMAEELKAIRQRIVDASTYKPRVPKSLQAQLRPYQKEGYEWISRLNKWGAGALLADDMGLGKTVQTIAFLLAKQAEGPALVVAPASVAPNWKTELEKFAPSLHVEFLNFAADRKQVIKDAKKGDVVVTTYGLLLSVKASITKKQWTTVCLDEAHIVKNRGAKTSAVAMQLKGNYRIMLTGTPVQNHLAELWNLFQFVNPGLLGGFDDFNHRFITPIEQQGDKEAQHQLDRLIKPFMLRRTKDKVAKELPEKEEIYQHVQLSKDEETVYELMRQRAETMLMAEQGRSVSVATLAEITRLRQCSCDARLIEEGKKIMGKKAGSKIEALVELLETIIDGLTQDNEGHLQGGVLVFSQFTSYLALIQEALKKSKIPYLYIDGTVDIKQRARLVKEFQDGACPVFLISLKAGGLGLNLTRANYVIHMDPWWNPAIEAQATDRAHRIGQQQAVTVYHLIAEGTIEEKIQRLHEQKQELVRGVLEGADQSHKLTGEQLLQMVKG